MGEDSKIVRFDAAQQMLLDLSEDQRVIDGALVMVTIVEDSSKNSGIFSAMAHDEKQDIPVLTLVGWFSVMQTRFKNQFVEKLDSALD